MHQIVTLSNNESLDEEYALVGTTYKCYGSQSGKSIDKTINEEVIAAYAGNYASNDAAKAAGATDIKNQLFGADGYKANFKNGVDITIFVKPTKGMKSVYHYNLKVIRNLSSDTKVRFTGLKDKNGNEIDSYALEGKDSYGEGNYVVFIVKNQDADLSEIAPVFTLGYSSSQDDDSPITLYDSEKNEAQISGQSLHNFEGKSVQYTASSEDKRYQANYWVQVVKADPDKAVFITSASDKDSNTSYDANGTMTTTREVLLDDTHEYVHDILIINRGSSAISKIKASLTDSDTLVLDDYFNLDGKYDLSSFAPDSWDNDKNNDWFANISVVRLKLKDYDSTVGKDIEGKLTLTSGGKTLAVINLTGTIGDPQIITESIRDAVKYVPYGVMIQNNNRYSDYVPGYTLESGELPDGMEIKKNGELYGVPKKAGKYKFTIKMYNQHPYQGRNGTSTKSYTLTVKDNTDPNVDGETDNGYKLKERVPNFRMSDSTQSYLFVSEGLFDTFKDVQKVFLDGELLTPGKDYTAESGSTRITLLASTLKKNGSGLHTIGVEFREKKATDQEAKHNSVNKEEGTLKRAAQNYRINGRSSSHSSGGSSGGSSGSGSSYSNSLSNGNAAEKASPNTVGFTLMPPTPGNWVKDSKTGAWNFMMPDKTTKRTGWIVYNQHWYYLNKDGVMLTGWQFLGNAWYCFSMTKDSKEGMLLTSWHFTDNKWVYLSETDDIFMGQMLINRRTPDGYFVGPNGAWDGKSKS